MENLLKIVINGEVRTVEDVHDWGYSVLDLDDGTEWYIFESTKEAGKAACEYWEDMAYNDPKEFTCMIGAETLVSWALNQSAGPGSTHVNNLDEWLDLWLDTPEEHFASYDGCECEVRINNNLMDELGFSDKSECVAYRHN